MVKAGRAQQNLLMEKVATLDRAIARLEAEISYIQNAQNLDVTCQRLSLYPVLDDYSYITRDCKFPKELQLKNMSKAVLRERKVGSGEGPVLIMHASTHTSTSTPTKTLRSKRNRDETVEVVEPEPTSKRSRGKISVQQNGKSDEVDDQQDDIAAEDEVEPASQKGRGHKQAAVTTKKCAPAVGKKAIIAPTALARRSSRR